MTCIIAIEKPDPLNGDRGAHEDWAKVTGKEVIRKPAVFRHTETGERFCNIVGGIAYPTAEKPGLVLVIGIQSDPVKFMTLETHEDANVFLLIEKAVQIREKCGFGLDSRILPSWYGDQEKFQTLVVKCSECLEKMHGSTSGLYIKDPVDLRERHAFPLYVRQIFDTLKTGRLDLNGDLILTGNLQGFQRHDAEKGKTEDFPAVGLLGGIVHSLQIQQPWLEPVDGQGTVFNIDI